MMQKNPQTRVDILWIFADFHRVLQVQIPSCTPAREFQQWHLAANHEIVYQISENFPIFGLVSKYIPVIGRSLLPH